MQALPLQIKRSEVIIFFETLYPPNNWPGIINIDYLTKEKNGERRLLGRDYIDSIDTLKSVDYNNWAVKQTQGGNIYFSCGLLEFSSSRRTKQSIVAITHLWTEIDNVKPESLNLYLSILPLPPTIAVFTGNGFHFYWALQQPCFETHAKGPAEEGLKKVHNWLPSDDVHNINRILRIPGTYNVKFDRIPANGSGPTMAEIVHIDGNNTYTLEQILSQPISYQEIKCKDEFKRKFILEGGFVDSARPDRSIRDFVIAKELLLAGHTKDDVGAILSNPKFGCSDKVLERLKDPLNSQQGYDYLQATIEKAYTEVGAISTGSAIFDNGSKIVRRKIDKNGFISEEEISNFCLVPLRRLSIFDPVVGMTEQIEAEFRSGKDKIKNVVLTTEDFTGKTKMLLACGVPMATFYGSESDFFRYVEYLGNREYLVSDATNMIGWYKHSFNTPCGTLVGEHIEYVDNGIQPHIKIVEEPYPIDDDFAAKLMLNVGMLHNENASLLTFGWVLASAFAPQVREAHHDQFPLLALSGAMGTGKTTLIRTLIRQLYGVMHDYSGKTTPAVAIRAMSYINALPMLIDEYEDKEANGTNMNAILRSLWHKGSAQRMNMLDRTSSLNICLQAPVAITCMVDIHDEAVRDRCLNLRVTDPNRDAGKRAIRFFDKLPMGGFLRTWLQEDPVWIKNIPKYGLLGGSVSDRQKHCIGTAAAALLYFCHKYNVDDITTAKLQSFYSQGTTAVVDPLCTIDELIAFLINSKRLVDGNPGFSVSGVRMRLHQAHFQNLVDTYAAQLTLAYMVDRRWIQGTLKDALTTKKILTYGKPMDLHRKTAMCFEIDMRRFPLTEHAYNASIPHIVTSQGVK